MPQSGQCRAEPESQSNGKHVSPHTLTLDWKGGTGKCALICYSAQRAMSKGAELFPTD